MTMYILALEYALRNAKLIFKSPLHLFYRASNIHTIATLLYWFVLKISGAV